MKPADLLYENEAFYTVAPGVYVALTDDDDCAPWRSDEDLSVTPRGIESAAFRAGLGDQVLLVEDPDSERSYKAYVSREAYLELNPEFAAAAVRRESAKLDEIAGEANAEPSWAVRDRLERRIVSRHYSYEAALAACNRRGGSAARYELVEL